MMLQSSGAAMSPNRTPITIEETGVATSYEATKNISCGNMDWRVNWRSGSESARIIGGTTVQIAGESKIIAESQAHIFDRLATVDDVSATCNESPDGVVRSSLLVVGNDAEEGKKALAQLHVDQNFKVDWSFDIVE